MAAAHLHLPSPTIVSPPNGSGRNRIQIEGAVKEDGRGESI
jgi:hypothetical protein